MQRNSFQNQIPSDFRGRSYQQTSFTSRAPPAHPMPIPTGGLPAGGFRNNTVLAMTPQIPTNTSRPTGSGAMDDANPPQRPRKRRRASGSPSSASKQPDFTPRATGYNPSSSLAIPGTEGQPSSQTSVSELSSQIHPKAPKRGWQRRRLLQQAPGADEKEAVSIFPTDNNGKIGNSIPINVLFEENLQQSFVSSSVVRCLGVDAQDLPVKRRAFFSKSSGLIQPQQYVVVAMEQVDIDNNRRTSQLGGMLVVDAARFKPGVHAVLRRDFFERARGGSLQPSDLQQNTHQPRFEDRYLFGQPAASLSQATSAMSGFTTENPFAHTATTSISPSFEDGSNTPVLPNYPPQNAYSGMPMLGIPSHPRHQGHPTGPIGTLPGSIAPHPQMWDPNLVTGDISPLVDPNLKSSNWPYWPGGSDWPPSGSGPRY